MGFGGDLPMVSPWFPHHHVNMAPACLCRRSPLFQGYQPRPSASSICRESQDSMVFWEENDGKMIGNHSFPHETLGFPVLQWLNGFSWGQIDGKPGNFAPKYTQILGVPVNFTMIQFWEGFMNHHNTHKTIANPKRYKKIEISTQTIVIYLHIYIYVYVYSL